MHAAQCSGAGQAAPAAAAEERWNRLLWGVEFIGTRGDPVLVGGLWAADLGGTPYPGEPARALLFCTRAQARAWCAKTMDGWRGTRQRDSTVARWRVRVVRVRETVRREAVAAAGLPCADCRAPNACTLGGACLEAYIESRLGTLRAELAREHVDHMETIRDAAAATAAAALWEERARHLGWRDPRPKGRGRRAPPAAT